jgi:hypothetical protein
MNRCSSHTPMDESTAGAQTPINRCRPDHARERGRAPTLPAHRSPFRFGTEYSDSIKASSQEHTLFPKPKTSHDPPPWLSPAPSLDRGHNGRWQRRSVVARSPGEGRPPPRPSAPPPPKLAEGRGGGRAYHRLRLTSQYWRMKRGGGPASMPPFLLVPFRAFVPFALSCELPEN